MSKSLPVEGNTKSRIAFSSSLAIHIFDSPSGLHDWQEDLFAVPVSSFFNWKRINKPDGFFNIEFGSFLNPKTNIYVRDARSHSLAQSWDYRLHQGCTTDGRPFVERAEMYYPSNELHHKRAIQRKPNREHRTFCPVPFGEIFAVLGSNAKDPEYEFLLQGTAAGFSGEWIIRFDNSKVLLRTLDFQAHSKFLIPLALSLLLEVGVLQVCLETYPTTEATNRTDDLVPMISMYVGSRSLLHSGVIPTLPITPFVLHLKPWYSNLAWRILVSTPPPTASVCCCGHILTVCSIFNVLT